MNISPIKIILLGVVAFMVLSAATLAYYLPKLRARAEITNNEMPVAKKEEIAAESFNPAIDQELVKSIPPHPDDLEQPAQVAQATLPTAQTPPPQTSAMSVPPRELLNLLVSPPIQFEIGSATLTSGSRKYLDRLTVLLKEQSQIRLAIEGHTDSQDRLGKNKVLSEQRAKAVLTYLKEMGIDSGRLESAGYGGGRPIADNETADGRARNRRIEFRIEHP